MGKGKKDRVIFCSPEFFKELKSMNAKFNLKVNIYVFLSSTGSKVDINTLQKMIKSKCIKLGFKKRVYFHLFRHTYLTKIYIQEYNIMYHKNKEYSSEKEQSKYLSFVL